MPLIRYLSYLSMGKFERPIPNYDVPLCVCVCVCYSLKVFRYKPECDFIIRWTINTKYYTADVAVWTANLSNELSIASFPDVNRIVALVMVFDTSDVSLYSIC